MGPGDINILDWGPCGKELNSLALYLTPPPVVGPLPPTTVREAMALPDYLALGAWNSAMAKEVKRVEGFAA